MIRPALGETVVALRRALAGAGVTPEQVSAVLLVGGTSRIPLVAHLLAGELGRPVAVDTNPKEAVCLGAALAAQVAAAPAAPVPAPAPAPAAAPAAPVAPPPAKKGSRAALVFALLGVAALAGVVAAVILLGGGDDRDGGEVAGATTTEQPDPYDAVEVGFVDECVAGQRGAEGAEDFCRCSFDAIRATIDFDRFQELEDETDPTGAPPAEIADAIAPCVADFAG